MVDRLYSIRISRPLGVCEFKTKDNNIALVYPRRKDGSLKELDVDQFSGQPFMLNANGFICNDIMMFEQCQSDSVARAVLSRIKVLHPEAISQDFKLDDMMDLAVPANFGTLAEYVTLNKGFAEKVYSLKQAEVQKKLDAEKALEEQKLFEKQAAEAAKQAALNIEKSNSNVE